MIVIINLKQAFKYLINKIQRYKVAGNYLSNNFQYILVSLARWTGTSCKSSAVIDSIINRVIVTVVMFNSYLDFSDFDTPIKMYVDDSSYFYVSPAYSKFARIYLKQNEANLNDNYLKMSSTSHKTFFSTDKTIVI